MGDIVDREISESKADSAIETKRARQAHYIEFLRLKGVTDPCGNDEGWTNVIAIYIKFIMSGANCNNKSTTRSDTIRGYLEAINDMFTARYFKAPVDLHDPTNLATIIFKNLQAEETIANQRSPITKEMYAYLLRQSKESAEGSEHWLLEKCASLARLMGMRAAEYLQKTQTKVDTHKYASGTEVIKAWTRRDVTFYDKKGRKILQFDENTRKTVARARIKWRIQKNRRNGQSVTIIRDYSNDEICPVLAAFDIYNHSMKIGQRDDMPMVAMKTENGQVKYLTGNRVKTLLRKVAREVHPDLTQEELNKFSAHSFRVWACVLLSEAGASPDLIKSRLRWMGDSYRSYLRDTHGINEMHRDALEKANAAIMDLLAELDNVQEDSNMGEYVDIE